MKVSPATSSMLPPADEKAAWVRRMFDRIAPRYDLFNDVLSAGIHRRWRTRAIDALAPRSGGRYLDLCAGTLDLARLIIRRAPGARVAGLDFAPRMLDAGREKARASRGSIRPVLGDALALPFAESAFDGCVIGFGLRNLADPAAGLAEMTRTLAPGGRLVVLEFTEPPGRAFRAAYHGYFHHVLPRIGGLVAGDASASRYLPASVAAFPAPADLARLMRVAGLDRVRYSYLTGGIAAIHSGVRT